MNILKIVSLMIFFSHCIYAGTGNTGFYRPKLEEFSNLEDFVPHVDYTPRFISLKNGNNSIYKSGLQMHYAEKCKDRSAPVFLLLHGEPSWSYLYRKMIPGLAEAGFCVIAPDLIGFGRSDKPYSNKYFTHKQHVLNLVEFIEKTGVGVNNKIHMFIQDWGGLIGLRLLAEKDSFGKPLHKRFKAVYAANTMLPPITVPKPFTSIAQKLPRTFKFVVNNVMVKRARKSEPKTLVEIASIESPMELLPEWIAHTRNMLSPAKRFFNNGVLVTNEKASRFKASDVIQVVTVTKISDRIRYAYDVPFGNSPSKMGSIIFPSLIPSEMVENKKAWQFISKIPATELEIYTFFSDKDPVTKGLKSFFYELPAFRHDEEISNAGHFLQEDEGEQIVDKLLNLNNK